MNRTLAAAAIIVAAVAALLLLGKRTADAPSVDETQYAWRDDLTAEQRLRVAQVTAAPNDWSVAQPFEENAGGATTTRAMNSPNAFSQPSENLSLEGRQQFALGNALFRKIWVTSPASTQASDGLGPLYNARACQRCHLKDGRGHPPEHPGDEATSLLLRVAIEPRNDTERKAIEDGELLTIPDRVYGGQIQDVAVPGVVAEGKVLLSYDEAPFALAGGESVTLRAPTFLLGDLGYGPLEQGALVSPRIAPAMIGLGLLEAVDANDILAWADPDDADGDGISGRAQMVRAGGDEEWVLGRFGWKAAAPSLKAQAAGAFFNDMGISSSLHPVAAGECTDAQSDCLAAPSGVQDALGPYEASDEVLDLVTFYTANLAVPARRDVDSPSVLAGKQLFTEAGCAACHRPSFVTRNDAPQEELRFQLIWPYTDMLLHDMGEALSSGRTVGKANGREWRTTPLWGLGLTEAVSGHEQLLHDGRARNVLEAILWHGGEATDARNAIVEMDPAEREALLAFLYSL
ncbi:MAG: di-heme oxidoredictase family protein [Pseudomonadota bacterium]